MKNRAFFVLFAIGMIDISATHAGVSSLNTNPTIRPISQYGVIQNVQNYSMNPFWNANSPYNQNFPQPVYVTGPELNTAECTSAVGALISTYCASNNNCLGMHISDIRPVIMLQLSRMPGHNYASNCSGYIDSEFDAYIEKYSATIPNGNVRFPGATESNPYYNASEFKLENPYERKDGTWNGEEWQKEKKERTQELKDLQTRNGAGNERLARAEFPETFADLSFSERMAVKAEGYEPFEGKSGYNPITIEKEEDYYNRMLQNHCVNHPDDPRCKRTTASNGTGATAGNGNNSSNPTTPGIVGPDGVDYNGAKLVYLR